jgi:Peptidase family S41
VVRRSGIDGINPGDAIVGIDGTPALAWYAHQLAITSAATDRYRFNLVTRKVFNKVYGPRTLDLRAPDGQVRTVVAQPVPYDDDHAEFVFGTAPVHRPSGFLTDLGAPDVYFLNMAFEVSPDEFAGLASIVEAQGARAMIIDMRGYPLGDHYHVAWALMPDGYYGPNFGGPIRTAPGQSYFYEPPPFSDPFPVSLLESYYGPAPTSYTGPVILLVGTDTVSAGENFSMMLANNGRPMHIVGRGTGGTNGEITGMEVLGHYSVSFTGLDVHNADGSLFIGRGIPVDVPVTLTQANVSGGNDPELNTALALFGP